MQKEIAIINNNMCSCGEMSTGKAAEKYVELRQPASDIFDLVRCAVFSIRFTGERTAAFPFASNKLSDILGLDPACLEKTASDFLSRIYPEYVDHFFLSAVKSAEHMKPWSIEFKFDHHLKGEIWIEWRAAPVFVGIELVWEGILFDITEQKTVQQQTGELKCVKGKSADECCLVNSSLTGNTCDSHGVSITLDSAGCKSAKQKVAWIEIAVNQTVDALYVIDLEHKQHRLLDVNDTACRMLGYSYEQLLGMTLYDVDVDITKEKLSKLASGLEVGKVNVYETRHVTKGGIIVPVEVASNVIVQDGHRCLISLVRDVSERKKVEERLRMAASVFEAAREGIAITDREGYVLDINPAFTKITGYTYGEVIGRKQSILSSGEHDVEFYKSMWSSLKNDGAWSGEIKNRRKYGELYTEHLNIVAVHDDHGEVKHYIGIFSDISLLKNQEESLQYLAYHDVLTNLPNRLLLSSLLSNALAVTSESESLLGVLYLDLDGFKPINDNYGHEVGDSVLVEVSNRLLGQVRSTDTVARIGGDEFVVLLAGVSDAEECAQTAARLLDVVTNPIILDDKVVNLTVSIGICLHSGKNKSEADVLIRHADQAMYMAKSGGRNQYVFYNQHKLDNTLDNERTVHDLRQALKDNQFTVYYQPIVNLASGKVIKAEALVRWHHPKFGSVPPSEFIPVAENGGLINEIGDLVFQNAARVAYALNNHNGIKLDEKLQVSVNRSPRQFFHRDGLDNWINYLEERGIPGELLGVEITEGLLLDDWPDVLKQLNLLRDNGVSISLDDFGTGYSALSYLTKFKIDYLKVDRTFVKDVEVDASYRAIVNSIIAMAKQLGIKTIAEGVETPEQEELLKAASCDMAQGFHYAKPMPEREFIEFVFANQAKECNK